MLKKTIIVLLIGLSIFAVVHFVSSQTPAFSGNGTEPAQRPFFHAGARCS